MNRTLILVFLTTALCVAPSFGGPILGTVTEGGRAIAEGTEAVVECSGEKKTVKTDKFGAYRVTMGKIGICTFTLTYHGQMPAASITSLSGPVSADFDLQSQGGKYKLVRR